MSKNKIESDLIKTIKKLDSLGISQEKGSIIYSGNEILRKGRFYFMDVNPGGHQHYYK